MRRRPRSRSPAPSVSMTARRPDASSLGRFEDHPLFFDAFIRVSAAYCRQPRWPPHDASVIGPRPGVPLRCAPVTASPGPFLWASSGMVPEQP